MIELDPQLRDALTQAAAISAALGVPGPGIEGVRSHAALAREYWNEEGPAMAQVLHVHIPGPTRQVPAILYKPFSSHELQPVFVYLHGGGFKIGTPGSNDRQMREIAQAWGGIVISMDYLHAPEHVFPSTVEEVASALCWLHGHGERLGVDGARIAFGGNSAGAAIAFGAAIGLGGAAWVKAAVGVVGAFSDDMTTQSMRDYGDAGVFPGSAEFAPMFAGYCPDPEMRSDPRYDIFSADMKFFPPTYLAAAQYDVLRSASEILAVHIKAAGGTCHLDVYPGMSHLFLGFSREVDAAKDCCRAVAAFLQTYLPIQLIFPQH
jgi:acetyl esterase